MKLLLPFLLQCFSHSPTTHEYLGSCKYWDEQEQKPYVVSVNQNLNVTGDERLMNFEFFTESCEPTTIQEEQQITYIRSYIWPWSDVNIQWLKYRNGKKGTGMMKWDRESGVGYLRRFRKYYDPQADKWVEKYFYVDLYDCNIDLTNVDFAKGK